MLSDPKKRDAYDRLGKDGVEAPEFDIKQVVQMVFGSGAFATIFGDVSGGFSSLVFAATVHPTAAAAERTACQLTRLPQTCRCSSRSFLCSTSDQAGHQLHGSLCAHHTVCAALDATISWHRAGALASASHTNEAAFQADQVM